MIPTLPYSLHILGHAERDLKRVFSSSPSTASLVAHEIRKLPTDPRPKGHRAIVGMQDLVHVRVGRYRIIYSVQDRLQAVIVVAVRLRGESTYKKVLVKDLSAKIRELEKRITS